MKKQSLILTSILFLCLLEVAQAQQWNGASNSSGVIHRGGKVGIGLNTASSLLHVFEDVGDGGTTAKLDAATNQNPNLKFSINGVDAANIRVNDGDEDKFQFQIGNPLSVVMSLTTDGMVGIGDNSPSNRLSIEGNETNQPSLLIRNSSYDSGDDGGTVSMQFAFRNHEGPKIEAWKRTFNTTGLKFYTEHGFNPPVLAMTLVPTASGANVGIGTDLDSNPKNYKLAVNGIIGAKEVIVENSSSTWPDFVFESDYNLKSLAEVESFIRSNKHLPDIPSAKEVGENGVNLGKMDALLLKKIEELTLYVIELDKRNFQLEAKIDRLKECKVH